MFTLFDLPGPIGGLIISLMILMVGLVLGFGIEGGRELYQYTRLRMMQRTYRRRRDECERISWEELEATDAFEPEFIDEQGTQPLEGEEGERVVFCATDRGRGEPLALLEDDYPHILPDLGYDGQGGLYSEEEEEIEGTH